MSVPMVIDNPAAGGGGAPTNDIFAGTRVVDPGGSGTDTTIAAAITNLPAAGGKIYVKQGTYSLAATLSMPDKNVEIEGSGDGTVLNLGANAIAAITVPDGLSDVRRYVFRGFKITGTDVAAQAGVRIADSNSRGIVSIIEVETIGVQCPIDITGGDANAIYPVQVMAEDCYFEPIADGSGILVNSPQAGENPASVIILRRVGFYNSRDPHSVVGGALCGDNWAYDFYIEDSILSLTNEDSGPFPVGIIVASGSSFLNYGSDFPIYWLFGSVLGLQDSCFVDCTFQSLKIQAYENVGIISGKLIDTQIDPYGAIALIEGCYVEVGANTPIAITQTGADLCRITGCYFAVGLTGDGATNYISASTSGTTVDGCVFEGLGTSGLSSIDLSSGNCVVRGCTFLDINYPGITDSAGQNRYSDNIYYDSGAFPSVSYYGTYYSSLSANGMVHFGIQGQTETGAFQNFYYGRSVCGLVGIGTFKNVGGNNLEVKEIATDFWGTTDEVTNTVAGGADRKLDPQANIGAARPPYKDYKVQVRHVGVASNFDLMISAAGPESPMAL